jgi:hypothetical protein
MKGRDRAGALEALGWTIEESDGERPCGRI